MADMVAYWIYRHYQSHDSRGFDLIRPYIHGYQGGRQGLIELVSAEKLAAIEANCSPDIEKYPFPDATPEGTRLPSAQKRAEN